MNITLHDTRRYQEQTAKLDEFCEYAVTERCKLLFRRTTGTSGFAALANTHDNPYRSSALCRGSDTHVAMEGALRAMASDRDYILGVDGRGGYYGSMLPSAYGYIVSHFPAPPSMRYRPSPELLNYYRGWMALDQ